LPEGSKGAVVYTYDDGAGYEVEFEVGTPYGEISGRSLGHPKFRKWVREPQPISKRLRLEYIAEAARTRRLLAEATTPWVKEQLAAAAAAHEQIAEEIERASAPDADAASPALSIKTPGR